MVFVGRADAFTSDVLGILRRKQGAESKPSHTEQGRTRHHVYEIHEMFNTQRHTAPHGQQENPSRGAPGPQIPKSPLTKRQTPARRPPWPARPAPPARPAASTAPAPAGPRRRPPCRARGRSAPLRSATGTGTAQPRRSAAIISAFRTAGGGRGPLLSRPAAELWRLPGVPGREGEVEGEPRVKRV